MIDFLDHRESQCTPVFTNRILDFSILNCPRSQFDYLKIHSHENLRKGDKVYLIHFNCPDSRLLRCNHKSLISAGEIYGVKGNEYLHTSDSFSGSSGSVLFSARLKVPVGLHLSGELDEQGKGLYNYALNLNFFRNDVNSNFSPISQFLD